MIGAGVFSFAQTDSIEIKSDPLQTSEDSTKDEKTLNLQNQIAKMSIEQKVGQLLILGFSSAHFNAPLKKTLSQIQPGAVILFKQNIKTLPQVALLNHKLQDYSQKNMNVPLFIMVDQEGGQVARIKTVPPLPTALAMGNSGDAELVKNLGLRMGELLQTLGFNMNLAPVLDLGDPNRRSFIGNRAFSGEPQKVGQMALAFSQGLHNARVIPTAKHFPGHGGLSQDSHKKTPQKLLNLEELEAHDLVPFKTFAELNEPSAVMIAHVAYPNIDSTGLPAAFSETMIQEVLRQRLGYRGLAITDDIEMLGADLAGSIEERAIKAVEAGCDMVMVAWSPQRQIRAHRGLLQAVQQGRITEARLNESVYRILLAKETLNQNPILRPKELNKKIKQHMAALGRVTKKISLANFKKGRAALLPGPTLIDDKQKIVIFSSDADFYSHFLSAKPKNRIQYRPLTPKTLSKVESFLMQHPDWLAIYFASGSITAQKLNSFSKEVKQRMVVINGAYPGAIEYRDQFRFVIDVNTPEPESGRWLAETLVQGVLDRLPTSHEPNPEDQVLRLRKDRAPQL